MRVTESQLVPLTTKESFQCQESNLRVVGEGGPTETPIEPMLLVKLLVAHHMILVRPYC